MEKFLVTGSKGLVGSAIRRLNLENFVYLDREDVDLTDFTSTKKVFANIRPSQVIHAAAKSGGLLANTKHLGQYFLENSLINLNVLEAARLAGVKKLISFMPTCVFPDKAPYPLNVQNLYDGPPHESNFGFAYAKRMLHVQSRAYRKEWGCNFIVAIPPNIYGPNDNFNLEQAHVLSALIHKCFLAKQNKTDLVVWGTGQPLREFVYADDIAKLTVWALENYNEEQPIIFSSGVETSIKNLANLIAKKMDFQSQIIFDTTKPDGQLRKPSDTSKLKTLNPDFQWLPVAEGLERTVEWFLNNYPNIRK